MTIKMLDCLHLECLVSHGKQLTAQLLPDHHAVNTHQTSAGEHTHCMVESAELCYVASILPTPSPFYKLTIYCLVEYL